MGKDMTNELQLASTTSPICLSEMLKNHSKKTHDKVDTLVMSLNPFSSLAHYQKFLQAQHEFHETLRPFYQLSSLQSKITGLAALGRADSVLADMADIGAQQATLAIARPTIDCDEAIGWLYCAEGSNVGAAILYKEAGKIHLTQTHGARHLTAHKEGRMTHWRNFKSQLDQLELTNAQIQKALQGSDKAFDYFRDVIKAVYQAS